MLMISIDGIILQQPRIMSMEINDQRIGSVTTLIIECNNIEDFQNRYTFDILGISGADFFCTNVNNYLGRRTENIILERYEENTIKITTVFNAENYNNIFSLIALQEGM